MAGSSSNQSDPVLISTHGMEVVWERSVLLPIFLSQRIDRKQLKMFNYYA